MKQLRLWQKWEYEQNAIEIQFNHPDKKEYSLAVQVDRRISLASLKVW